MTHSCALHWIFFMFVCTEVFFVLLILYYNYYKNCFHLVTQLFKLKFKAVLTVAL